MQSGNTPRASGFSELEKPERNEDRSQNDCLRDSGNVVPITRGACGGVFTSQTERLTVSSGFEFS